jgi:hypothetical protein
MKINFILIILKYANDNISLKTDKTYTYWSLPFELSLNSINKLLDARISANSQTCNLSTLDTSITLEKISQSFSTLINTTQLTVKNS